MDKKKRNYESVNLFDKNFRIDLIVAVDKNIDFNTHEPVLKPYTSQSNSDGFKQWFYTKLQYLKYQAPPKLFFNYFFVIEFNHII